MNLIYRFVVASVGVLALGSLGAGAGEKGGTVAGITVPSQRLKLAFVVPGLVKEVAVKEGDQVKAEQMLMTQDDRMDRKQLEAMELEANSTHPVDAAKTDWEAKKVELQRVEKLRETNVSSEMELLQAKLAADVAGIRVKQAEMESAQKKIEAARQKDKLDLMKLRSPVDGVVEKLTLGPGEAADPQNREGACVVVKNDPMWIEVRMLSTAQVKQIRLGQTMKVRHDGEQQWQEAKVVYVAPVADAASDTHPIRLEMANPENRPTGMHVMVQLPEATAKAE